MADEVELEAQDNPAIQNINFGNEETEEDTSSSAQIKKLFTKQNIIIASLAFVVLLALTVLVSVLIFRQDPKPKSKKKITSKEIIKNIQEKRYVKFTSNLSDMVKEADKLYKQGDIELALRKYKQIAENERFVSYHNMGVAYMKNKEYAKALDSFEKSLEIPGNECIASINAAVSALYMSDNIKFNKYINLAEKSLDSCVKDPLYHYYYALILFYQGKYIEALAILNNNKQKNYTQLEYKLKSDIYMLLNDNANAVNNLEKQDDKDYRKIALAYSRMGEYQLAVNNIANQVSEDKKIIAYNNMATSLNFIKLGKMISASTVLESLSNDYGDAPSKLVPINLILNKNLFEASPSRQSFRRISKYSDEYFFKLFLYFSPYKIFNHDKVINFIRRGNKSIFVDNIKYSKKNFSESKNFSKLSEFMIKGVKYALEYQIRKANKTFQSIQSSFPNSSSLYYNLALSYAHLGLYAYASKYFKNAYYFDNSNKLAKLLAFMSEKLSTNQLDTKDLVKFRDSLENETNNQEYALYAEVAGYMIGSLNPQYFSSTHDSVLANFFKTFLASKLGEKKKEIKYAYRLKSKLSDNFVANIMHLFANYSDEDPQQFSRRGMSFLKNNKAFMNSIYYGPKVGGQIYIELSNISGMSYNFRDILKEKLLTEKEDVIGILELLAMTDIYLNFFEESFVLYNKLIDDFQIDDANTLFYAAVAAIGAKHPENAIALLELSILNKAGINQEAYYALGLLYLEAKNIEATKIQLSKIQSNEFVSRFFDFELQESEQ